MATTHRTENGLDRSLLVLGGVVVVGMIMAVLDATIVNVAIPTLGEDLHTSISTIQWVMTGYLLAFASVIPISGWAVERYGAKPVWIGSLLLFVATSALSGAAWSIEALIAFRVLQGFGAGLIMPVGQTILAQASGPRHIGRMMSVIGVPILLAPIFGPVIGGAIVDQISWRWIFFVNLPVGVAAIALAWRLLPGYAPRLGGRLDLGGLALLSPGLALFVYGMSAAGAGGGFGDGRALAGIAGGLALIALFVWHALRRRGSALIDLTLLARRGFAAAAATNLVVGIALFGTLILLPLYYQLARAENPLSTGVLLMPQGIGAALAMPIAGRLTDEIGARVVVPAGVLLALAGIAVYTQVGPQTSYIVLAAALLVVGLGLGATIVPSMAVAYQSVPREAMAQATSAINVIQRIAGSIGTALLAVMLQHQIAANGARSATAIANAFGATFWVALGLVAVGLVPALLLPRSEPSDAGDTAVAPEPA